MAVGGVVVDSGNFDWNAHADKFPGLTTPDETYHGIVYTEKFGKAAYITKMTAQLMRDLGSIPSPMNCFLNTGNGPVPKYLKQWIRIVPMMDICSMRFGAGMSGENISLRRSSIFAIWA
jgi:hypothetical protein